MWPQAQILPLPPPGSRVLRAFLWVDPTYGRSTSFIRVGVSSRRSFRSFNASAVVFVTFHVMGPLRLPFVSLLLILVCVSPLHSATESTQLCPLTVLFPSRVCVCVCLSVHVSSVRWTQAGFKVAECSCLCLPHSGVKMYSALPVHSVL